MQILSGMSGDRHCAGFYRVMILAMAPACAYMKPAVVFNLPDDFPDFHFSRISNQFRHVFAFVFSMTGCFFFRRETRKSGKSR
jgi:hypothetical protein